MTERLVDVVLTRRRPSPCVCLLTPASRPTDRRAGRQAGSPSVRQVDVDDHSSCASRPSDWQTSATVPRQHRPLARAVDSGLSFAAGRACAAAAPPPLLLHCAVRCTFDRRPLTSSRRPPNDWPTIPCALSSTATVDGFVLWTDITSAVRLICVYASRRRSHRRPAFHRLVRTPLSTSGPTDNFRFRLRTRRWARRSSADRGLVIVPADDAADQDLGIISRVYARVTVKSSANNTLLQFVGAAGCVYRTPPSAVSVRPSTMSTPRVSTAPSSVI